MPAVPNNLALDTIANGAQILAQPLRDNYSEIQAEFNKVVAILDGGASGEVLTNQGSGNVDWATPASSGISVLNRAASTVDVANSASETALFSHSVTGGDMGTDKMLRLTLLGDLLYNNNIANTLTLRVKFGGTTFWADVTSGNTLSANRQPWRIGVEVVNLGANNSQMIVVNVLTVRNDAAAPTSGIGRALFLDSSTTSRDHPTGGVGGISTLAAIDTSSAQTLEVSAQWSAASANNSFRKRIGILELV